MTLYELVTIAQDDFDTYDTVYDAEVTVCYIPEPFKENYDRFCMEIIKKVEVEKFDVSDASAVCKWADLVTRNMEKFRAFTKRHWFEDCQYEDDDDEFVYQWITEIHNYTCGMVCENTYGVLVELVSELE